MGIGAWVKRKLLSWIVGDVSNPNPPARALGQGTIPERMATTERQLAELQLTVVHLRDKLIPKIGAIDNTREKMADDQETQLAQQELNAALMEVAASGGQPDIKALIVKYPHAARGLLKDFKV